MTIEIVDFLNAGALILMLGTFAYGIFSISEEHWKGAWFWFTACGSTCLMFKSIVPGLWGHVLIIILIAGSALIWSCVSFLVALHDLYLLSKGRFERRELPWGLFAVLLGCLCLAILETGTVRKSVFSLYEAQFHDLARTAIAKGRVEQVQETRIGPYSIDHVIADDDGAVFFRTSVVGFGSDEVSYGFAWKPNQDRNPFGHTNLRFGHLYEDWFDFEASR